MKRRTKKVKSLLMGELSVLLVTEISDPMLQNVSISDVKLTEDLHEACVFYTLRGDKAPAPKQLKEIGKGFQRATPYLRRTLGKKLGLRTVPELKFAYDAHLDQVGHILTLLDTVAEVTV